MQTQSSALLFRVVMIGDAYVGKTSVLNHLLLHSFNPGELSTVAANYQSYSTIVDDLSIEMQIWDTAGQEVFRSLAPIYYRDSDGAVLVYDVTNHLTFDHLTEWISAFTAVAKPGAIIVVAANKSDLPDHKVQVSLKDAQSWTQRMGYELQLTSAKTGAGVKPLFEKLARGLAVRFGQNGAAKRGLLNADSNGACQC
jgi:small GTP-binding protein